MMRVVRWPGEEARIRRELLEESAAERWQGSRALCKEAGEICEAVALGGDSAVLDFVRRFDGVDLGSAERLAVSPDELADGAARVPAGVRRALETAKERISAFHGRQAASLKDWKEEEDGNVRGELLRPLERVGIYVPGGRASYPSSLLMGALPARVAGVGELLVATPPGAGGEIAREVLLAAELAGVDTVYRMGGAHAVAALAFGTETVGGGRGVDKIVGPGGRYVTAAKQVVSGTVGIDSLAGPSELMVVADETAPARAVAWDLMGQAEHGEDSVCLLVTDCEALAAAVDDELVSAIEKSARAQTIRGSLEGKRSAMVIVDQLDPQTVGMLVNTRAPEHLELVVKDPESLLAVVRNAGCILVGPYSPCALGDYWAGPNHIIPTAGGARFSSPLGVADFMTRSSLIRWTRDGLRSAARDIKSLGEVEGLTVHGEAAESRESPAGE